MVVAPPHVRRSLSPTSNQARSLPNSLGDLLHVLQIHDIRFARPTQIRRQPLVHEEIIDQILGHGDLFDVSERDDRRGDLAETELLGRAREGVVGIEGFALHLAVDLRVGEHVCGDGRGCPEGAADVEDGFVEDVVRAEESVGAREGGVVLEHVVNVEVVEREIGSVGLGVRDDGHVEHEFCEGGIEVQTLG